MRPLRVADSFNRDDMLAVETGQRGKACVDTRMVYLLSCGVVLANNLHLLALTLLISHVEIHLSLGHVSSKS